MKNEREINALIQLLDDSDREVFRHVHDKLLSLGTEVIPTLEQAWEVELNPATHERLQEIIHEIQFDSLLKEFQFWLGKENPDLLTGAFLIGKYFYPEISFEEIQKKITKLKQSIWLELNYNQTPLEQVQIFNQVFYSYHGFSGLQASTGFSDFCINHVLETKHGNAVSIGILYQILANDLNLPVYGVNLNHHYILAFCKKTILEFSIDEKNEREVMFYLNPINKGAIFSRHEIKDYLEKLKEPAQPKYFLPADNRNIILELLNYLLELYLQKNETEAITELTVLRKLL